MQIVECSLFLGTHGYNIWCIGQESPHFEETSPIWDYSEALQLESSKRGKAPCPSGRILLLNAQTFHVSRYWMAAGDLSAQVRRNPPGRVEEGA